MTLETIKSMRNYRCSSQEWAHNGYLRQEECEDTKGYSESVIKEVQMTHWPKGQTTIYKTLHRKQKFAQYDPCYTRDILRVTPVIHSALCVEDELNIAQTSEVLDRE